jgi:CRISPR/Cas system CSM-associated protein Csm3 (group 7 of RAMP superfamily)
MGDVEPSDEGAGQAAASHLLVFNAELRDGNRPQIRDHVGINRSTGAAARRVAAKYDREIIPAGARFALRMELREPAHGESLESDEQLLAAALGEWHAGRLALGGGVGRGLGAFTLTDVHYHERDLDTADALMDYLRADDPWKLHGEDATAHLEDKTAQLWQRIETLAIESTPPVLKRTQQQMMQATGREELPAYSIPISTRWAVWEFTLHSEGPFLINDTTTAGLYGFDHAPSLSEVGNWHKPVLPGSSLRGVLRSQAERIARTLVSYRAASQGKSAAEYFLNHCPACDPLARRLEAGDYAALESCDSLLHYQAQHPENEEVPSEDLCLACQLFGSTRNGSRLRVEDAPFAGAKPLYKMLDFLAVDRFTGGGAEHLKFDALALWKPAFKVRLWLENPADWELGWLSLVLRDLAEGWLRVGFGAAKGFGEVTITEGTLRLASLPEGSRSTDKRTVFTVDKLTFGDAKWQEKQPEWIAAFHHRLVQTDAYRQGADMQLPADSYFGTQAAAIYRFDVGSRGGAS